MTDETAKAILDKSKGFVTFTNDKIYGGEPTITEAGEIQGIPYRLSEEWTLGSLQKMAKLWLCCNVIRAILEYHVGSPEDIKLIEPHETISNLQTQEINLECLGCKATGVKRWANNWQNEFEHEADCKWVQLIEALEAE